MADVEYTELQIAQQCNELNWNLLTTREDARFDSGAISAG
jgi:hypothetical protein